MILSNCFRCLNLPRQNTACKHEDRFVHVQDLKELVKDVFHSLVTSNGETIDGWREDEYLRWDTSSFPVTENRSSNVFSRNGSSREVWQMVNSINKKNFCASGHGLH